MRLPGFRIVSLCVAVLLWAGASGAQVESLNRAEVQMDTTPPTEIEAWSTVALPDRWLGSSDAASDHWYRFSVSGGGGPWGVLVLDVAMNAAVYWNGVLLGDGGSFEPPMAQNFHRPLYFRVPRSMVREGANELLVRVAAPAHFYGWLGEVRTGPNDLLEPIYQSELDWRHRLPQVTSLLGAVMVVLLFIFWTASRDSTYAWFAGAVALATFANLNLHVQTLPVSTMAWARAVQLAMCWHPIAQSIFIHRFLGIERPRTDRALLIAAAGLAVTAILIPAPLFLPVFTQLLVPTIALYFYLVVLVLWKIRALPQIEIILLLGVCVLITLLGLHDALSLWGGPSGKPRFWGPLAGPLVMFFFGGVLTVRFGRTLRRAQRNNVELEERVLEKHEELEDQYQRLRDFERETVLTDERRRIMREMHDGLGGRIVETLAMVEDGDTESEELADSLRASLDEMRLIIDSLDPLIADLPTLLATVRERFERGLRRRGVELVWRVGELPDLTRLGPQGFLHLSRIIQEAFTNAARHARAQRVVLSAGLVSGADRIRIAIEDDGCGIAPDEHQGRGIGNMRERAAALGGDFEVESNGTGTRVRLELPI